MRPPYQTSVMLGLLLLAPAPGWADGFTTRAGTLGILDVPTAETMGVGGGWLSLDLFVEHQATRGWSVAPLPLVVVGGLADALDLGLAIRDSGLPGDPVPSFPMLTVTGKLAFLKARGLRPGLAVSATLDRINWKVDSSLRLVASTAWLGPFRASAFGGAGLTELTLDTLTPIGGVAVALRHASGLEFVADGLRGSGGWLVGGGLRWAFTDHVALSLVATWKPDDNTIRVALSVSVFTGMPSFEVAPASSQPTPEAEKAAAGGPRPYTDPRPRFRLKIHQSTRSDGAGRHLQNPQEPGDEVPETIAPPPAVTPPGPSTAKPPPPPPASPAPVPQTPPVPPTAPVPPTPPVPEVTP